MNRMHKKQNPLNINGLFLKLGGGAGIRTLDASFSSHTPLAGRISGVLGNLQNSINY